MLIDTLEYLSTKTFFPLNIYPKKHGEAYNKIIYIWQIYIT